jgi:DNA modification methylase
VKKVASMGWGDYRWKHEPILYCHKKGESLNFYGDRKQYTEWSDEPTDEELLKTIRAQVKKEEEGDSTVWRLHREMKYDHPTQKPVKLVQIAIRNSSKRDDIVVDLFGGSGSCLIAAHKINRTCYTMELDPKYVDVIIKRYEMETGEKAIKI